jgi:tetratricopeptide (TPR) repeat protein
MTASSATKTAKRAGKKGSSTASNLSPSPGRRTFERQTLVLCLALVAAVLVSYSSVVRNQFLDYDDGEYITENAPVRAGVTWATAKWAFTNYYGGNWDPLTWLSHALDCDLFGLNPVGHHAVNVLLHAASTVLLFLMLQSATGFRWRSLMVAALFALHPINVESVAWAAERKNVLSMLFFLLALLAYGWYARKPGLGRYSAVFFAFLLALLSKPQVITFPCLLLLWDYWPLGRVAGWVHIGPAAPGQNIPQWSIRRLLLEKVPLLVLSAASARMATKAQRVVGTVKDFSQYSLTLRLENAAIAYLRYLGKVFWPSNLVALYPHPTRLYPAWQVGAALILLLLVSAAVLLARKQPYLAVGWFWFLGSLVPMIGLVQVGDQAMADRYAYLPFIGLFLASVWLLADVAIARRISARWLAIPAISCVLVLGILTYRQVGYWHDTESLWRRTLVLTQDNYVAHKGLAAILLRDPDRTEEAMAHYRTVLALRPDDARANVVLGEYEQRQGNLAAAVEHYQTVALSSATVLSRAVAYANLGFTYGQMGQPLKAKQALEMSLQFVPDQVPAMVALGLIAETNGDPAEAVRRLSRAVAIQPTDVELLLLAHALQQEGRAGEANTMAERAARTSLNLPKAQRQVEALLAGK